MRGFLVYLPSAKMPIETDASQVRFNNIPAQHPCQPPNKKGSSWAPYALSRFHLATTSSILHSMQISTIVPGESLSEKQKL